MKKQNFVAAFLIILLSFSTKAQEIYQDVIYLKNGTIIHGMIIEQVPNKSFTIQTNDENIFVCKIDDIEKITKEETYKTRQHKTVPIVDYDKIKKSGYINTTEMGFAFSIDNNNSYNSFSIQTINGYLFNPNFSAGIGIGIDKYRDHNTFIPIFADLKFYLLKNTVTPFISADIGYSMGSTNNDKGGVLFNPAFGFKVCVAPKMALIFSIGYRLQKNKYYGYYYGNGNQYLYSEKIDCISFKTGLTF